MGGCVELSKGEVMMGIRDISGDHSGLDWVVRDCSLLQIVSVAKREVNRDFRYRVLPKISTSARVRSWTYSHLVRRAMAQAVMYPACRLSCGNRPAETPQVQILRGVP